MLLQDGVQLIRHEQISAVLITWTSVWEWLGGNPSLDRLLVLSAVVSGHHLKARITEFGQPQAEIDTLLRVWWENRELRSHLSKISTKLNLSRPAPWMIYRNSGDLKVPKESQTWPTRWMR